MYKETQWGSSAHCLKKLWHKQSILLAIHHFHIHLTRIFFIPPPPPPQFLLGITLVPREIEDNGYAKFWEVTKVCGLSENGE